MNSPLQQNFQNSTSYIPSQVPLQQNEEQNDLEKSMEDWIQTQNDVTRSINRLETQMSQMVNTMNVRNEETLLTQFFDHP